MAVVSLNFADCPFFPETFSREAVRFRWSNSWPCRLASCGHPGRVQTSNVAPNTIYQNGTSVFLSDSIHKRAAIRNHVTKLVFTRTLSSRSLHCWDHNKEEKPLKPRVQEKAENSEELSLRTKSADAWECPQHLRQRSFAQETPMDAAHKDAAHKEYRLLDTQLYRLMAPPPIYPLFTLVLVANMKTCAPAQHPENPTPFRTRFFKRYAHAVDIKKHAPTSYPNTCQIGRRVGTWNPSSYPNT